MRWRVGPSPFRRVRSRGQSCFGRSRPPRRMAMSVDEPECPGLWAGCPRGHHAGLYYCDDKGARTPEGHPSSAQRSIGRSRAALRERTGSQGSGLAVLPAGAGGSGGGCRGGTADDPWKSVLQQLQALRVRPCVHALGELRGVADFFRANFLASHERRRRPIALSKSNAGSGATRRLVLMRSSAVVRRLPAGAGLSR